MRVLGIDGGFGNIGYTVAEIKKSRIIPIEMDVIKTQPSHKKKRIFVEDDNLMRIKEIANRIDGIIQNWNINAICMEQFSNIQLNANSSRKTYGVICCIATLSYVHDIPIFQTTPQSIKKKICGKASATKVEIQEAINKQFEKIEDVLPKTKNGKGIAKGKLEHCYDALAAIITCLDSNMMKLMSNS